MIAKSDGFLIVTAAWCAVSRDDETLLIPARDGLNLGHFDSCSLWSDVNV